MGSTMGYPQPTKNGLPQASEEDPKTCKMIGDAAFCWNLHLYALPQASEEEPAEHSPECGLSSSGTQEP